MSQLGLKIPVSAVRFRLWALENKGLDESLAVPGVPRNPGLPYSRRTAPKVAQSDAGIFAPLRRVTSGRAP
jgi:hypothetical protein